MKQKIFNQLAIGIILCVIGYVMYPFIAGGSKMEEFCASVRTGETKENIVDRATEASYSTKESTMNNVDILMVVDSRAMGRHICEVTLNENQVVTSKYVFND